MILFVEEEYDLLYPENSGTLHMLSECLCTSLASRKLFRTSFVIEKGIYPELDVFSNGTVLVLELSLRDLFLK